ncbi:hypothetical protein FKM82_029390 [Ascaphus truei]
MISTPRGLCIKVILVQNLVHFFLPRPPCIKVFCPVCPGLPPQRVGRSRWPPLPVTPLNPACLRWFSNSKGGLLLRSAGLSITGRKPKQVIRLKGFPEDYSRGRPISGRRD